MILFASRVPFTGRLSCLLIHSRQPQPGPSFNTSICVSQATLVTDSRLYLESEYRNPFARHRLGDSQPRTSKIPLAHTCATSCCGKVTGSDSVGSCTSGSACASDAVSFASFPFRYYLQPIAIDTAARDGRAGSLGFLNRPHSEIERGTGLRRWICRGSSLVGASTLDFLSTQSLAKPFQ
jgi:hypothetical protein